MIISNSVYRCALRATHRRRRAGCYLPEQHLAIVGTSILKRPLPQFRGVAALAPAFYCSPLTRCCVARGTSQAAKFIQHSATDTLHCVVVNAVFVGVYSVRRHYNPCRLPGRSSSSTPAGSRTCRRNARTPMYTPKRMLLSHYTFSGIE